MGNFTKRDLLDTIEKNDLSGKAIALLHAIFVLKDKSGCCCVNYKRLMLVSGIGNRNTVSAKIEELSDAGILKAENQFNMKTNSREANKYTLVPV